MAMDSGIYKITHNESGRVYIGLSKVVIRRLLEHRKYLKNGTHANQTLQYYWNKYGRKAFTFELWFKCDIIELKTQEKVFIDEYVKRNGWNAVFNEKPSLRNSVSWKKMKKANTKYRLLKDKYYDSPEYKYEKQAYYNKIMKKFNR